MSGARNLQLESLRGLAAVSVFVFHASNRIGDLFGVPYRLLGHLDLGVRVFFLLSVYLIYRPFVRSHIRYGTGKPTGEYAWKSCWRIYPSYWLALVFAIAIGRAELSGISGVLKHGLLLQTYFRDRDGAGVQVAWTLVVEILLYMFLPVFAAVVRRIGRILGRGRAELFAAGTFILAALVCLGPYVERIGIFRGPGIARVFESAAIPGSLGMMLAVIESVELSAITRQRIVRIASPIGRWWAAAGLVLALLAGVIANGFETPNRAATGWQWINVQWGHGLVALLLVTPLVLAPDAGGRLRRLLAKPGLVMLGTVSYSLYLWHLPVLTFTKSLGLNDSLGSAIPAAVGAFVASVGVAWLGQRYVEAPCLRVAARWRVRPKEPKSLQPSL